MGFEATELFHDPKLLAELGFRYRVGWARAGDVRGRRPAPVRELLTAERVA
ncbi:hypothetical protein ACIRRA_36445 [Nocardia sp. NPDC101769]|uniref:hypothetical protein n=1 Tax=Nocardia sp. NPDC101769 TaxID=3364333 RepID=UPI00380C46DE